MSLPKAQLVVITTSNTDASSIRRLNISIDHETTDRGDQSSRASSLGDDGESYSDTGGHLSYSHSPQSSHDANEEDSWEGEDHDDIGPSESVSRPQTSNHERPLVEAPLIEESTARRPSRRHVPHPHPRHTAPPRTRRSLPSDGPESVDSHEDWQGYAHGPPQPYHRQYANYAANYPPASAQFQTYPQQSLVPVNQQQMVPFGFSSYPQQPGGPASNYFSPNHHAMGGHMMGPSSPGPYSPPAGYYPYPHHGYPMPNHHLPPPPVFQTFPAVYSPPPAPAPVPAASAPQPASSPPPPPETSNKDGENIRRLEKLLLEQREEQTKKEAAAEKAVKDKEAAAEKAVKDKVAQAEAEAKRATEIKEASDAAAANAKAEAAKDYKAAEERKAADKAAQAEAEAKRAAEIKEASDAGAAKARAEAAKEQKAAEEKKAAEAKAAAAKAAEAKAAADAATAAAAAAAPPPPPKEKDKPIKFKDAVGRKFSFPFHLCATWSVSLGLLRILY